MTALVTSEGDVVGVAPGTPTVVGATGQGTLGVPSEPWAPGRTRGLELIGDRVVSYERLYRTQTYVAAAANKLYRQIARLPLKVYTEPDANGARTRVREGRLYELLERPAPRCGPIHLKQWLSFPPLLHGNGLVAKVRSEVAGPPTSLWRLEWGQAQEGRDHRGGPITHWTTTQFGERLAIDARETVHVRWEPPSGELGVSPLEQLGVTLRIEDAAQRHTEATLRNGATPPSALQTTEAWTGLDPDVRGELFKQLRDDIDTLYAGPENNGRPAILPPGVTWATIGHDAREAELIKQRLLTREEVASVYDIPPPLIGILDHATYSNVGEMHRMLFTTVLGPWITLIEETLQAQLIDEEPAFAGQFVEFDLSDVLRGDTLKEIQALQTAVLGGLMSINEARAVRNLPRVDLDICDEPLVPTNNLQPVGAIGGTDEEQPAPFTATERQAVLTALEANTALAQKIAGALPTPA